MIPCNQVVSQTFALLNSAQAFNNPQASILDNIKTATSGRIVTVDQMILQLDPLDPQYPVKLANLESLKLKLVNMVGGQNYANFLNSPIGQFLGYTDFISGRRSTFPAELASIASTVPGAAVLAGATFFTVLSVAGALPHIKSELCEESDPDDPCAHVNGMFGAVLGEFNSNLANMLAVMSGAAFLQDIEAAIQKVQTFVEQVLGKIVEGLTKMTEAFIKATNHGIAKLLEALKIDPCIASLLHAVGTQQLRNVLQV